MKNLIAFFKYYKSQIAAFVLILLGGALGMLGLIDMIPVIAGIAGIMILAIGMFVFCLMYTSQREYKKYYKECYEIEHSTIEAEIRQSMLYHRYQEAVLNRYESVCRDLGLSNEQKDYLLILLMDEKTKVDEELKNASI